MNQWANFFAAMAESAATLTGLIFVGASIYLSKMLSMPALPDRALESLILLLNILLVSVQALIPDQSPDALGWRSLFISGIVWFFMIYLDTRIWRRAEKRYHRHAIQNMIFTQLAILPFIIAGIMIICQGYSGIYWLLPGIVFSFIKAVVDAWVLLVEIQR